MKYSEASALNLGSHRRNSTVDGVLVRTKIGASLHMELYNSQAFDPTRKWDEQQFVGRSHNRSQQ